MGKYKFTAEDFEKPEVSNENEKASSQWKKPLGIAATFVLLCGAGYAGYSLLNNEPKETEKSELMSQGSKTSEDTSMDKDVSDERDMGKVEQNQTTENTESVTDGCDSVTIQQVESPPAVDNPSGEDLNVPAISGTLEQKAKHVIRGDFGNGKERKDKLGSEYDDIQRKVNEMYRNGELYM